ncbi:nuclear transport factor 2 family protein [Rhizobium mayense]|uniref:Nuclear transport factor 2 family protein n=1 Tax=Rhizobium mayense TaxID=1312184 RepID=A0ABT7JN83_9HYPH|nr:nuclear transport factor 2 family protein [Rhizobium mayense]MDL2397706.1 nuclear transport factor 2 family protein [Rhizobium mayense]
MTDATTIAERYLAVWNETEAERRRALITEAWTESCSYVDPLMRGEGHEQIDALVAAVHTRLPGFRFKLAGLADRYGDNIRFSWSLGTEGEEPLIKGTDFAILDGERLKTVHGFLDQAPASL